MPNVSILLLSICCSRSLISNSHIVVLPLVGFSVKIRMLFLRTSHFAISLSFTILPFLALVVWYMECVLSFVVFKCYLHSNPRFGCEVLP